MLTKKLKTYPTTIQCEIKRFFDKLERLVNDLDVLLIQKFFNNCLNLLSSAENGVIAFSS